MGVLLADRRLGVRRRAAGVADAHGYVSGGSWGPLAGPWAGRAEEGPDAAQMGATGGRRWVLAVDPAAWPLTQGDLVVDVDAGQQWLVVTADLRANAADSAVDYVRVEAHIRTGGGTRP